MTQLSEREIARSANELPDMFRDRVDARALRSIEQDIWAGEWALGIDSLVAKLIKAHVSVTLPEYESLKALSLAMDYPQLLDQLHVTTGQTG